MTEPRTKAGRRLIREWPPTLGLRDAILAIEAEAAAGPRDEAICYFCGRPWQARDEGLDVERLARAMQNVEDELTATNIAYEYAALAKASK